MSYKHQPVPGLEPGLPSAAFCLSGHSNGVLQASILDCPYSYGYFHLFLNFSLSLNWHFVDYFALCFLFLLSLCFL